MKPGIEVHKPSELPDGAVAALTQIERADIVIGIPSYNNARTIGHVVRAAQAGLAKYFPQFAAVVLNSDGGSADGTREAVLSANLSDQHLMMVSTPMLPVHRLSFPYHGIPGKGSAFRLVFAVARELRAKACAVLDADLRSVTPEWIDLLLRPVLYSGYDFVAPYYHRHKYDGTITNSIVYPLTRALYGARIRQPIGGDFGMSERLYSRYLERTDWETDVARYGIDIWMTTIAVAERFRVCQSFLGAKLHDAKDPGSDLSAMLEQVVGSVFALMEEYEQVWRSVHETKPVDLFGFRFDVGLDPIEVNVDRMLTAFRRGCRELGEIWAMALAPNTLRDLIQLGRESGTAAHGFRLPDELWVRTIYEFACAYRRRPIERSHLLRSLTPLYLARVASFVLETSTMISAEVETRVEELSMAFEHGKPYVAELWGSGRPHEATPDAQQPRQQQREAKREEVRK
ncbi:MAG TPA: cell wall biosynthesis glycosyltransferase [Bryobacteraceae bacterium]|nr:cell wall biosynthesis glycosyltransferase [Bryobacteraceae bacterium]